MCGIWAYISQSNIREYYEYFKKMAVAQQREWNSFHNKEVFFNTLLKLAN